MLLSILIGLTVLALAVLVYGWKTDADDAMAGGVMLLLLTVIIGWVVMGNLIPQKTIRTEVIAYVLHDQNACHLSVGDVIVATYNDVVTVKFLTERETVTVINTQNYNLYGGKCPPTSWEIANKQP